MMRKILPKTVGCVVVLAMLIVILPANAAVVVVSGADDTDDTFVSVVGDEVDLNFGASETIIVGDPVIVIDPGEPTEYSITNSRYGLLKWDLSGVVAALAGPGQRINVDSAKVTVDYQATGEADAVIGIYNVAEANADWVEGTSDGTTAVLHEEPSWQYKSQELIPWASGQGGLPVIGVDYIDPNDPNGIDCSDNDNGSSAYFTVQGDVSTALVQSWIDDAETNGGILLKQIEAIDTYVVFMSSEFSDPARVPKLTINYTLGPLECGDAGTGQLKGDISGPDGEPDCKVDGYDLKAFTSEWLDCSNPHDSKCNQ